MKMSQSLPKLRGHMKLLLRAKFIALKCLHKKKMRYHASNNTTESSRKKRSKHSGGVDGKKWSNAGLKSVK